jgi:hypothetical protein
MNDRRFLYFLLILLLTCSVPVHSAWAYIGPGAGLSAIGSLLALLAAIFLAIFGFVWYPIKRLLKRRNVDTNAENQKSADGSSKSPEGSDQSSVHDSEPAK